MTIFLTYSDLFLQNPKVFTTPILVMGFVMVLFTLVDGVSLLIIKKENPIGQFKKKHDYLDAV